MKYFQKLVMFIIYTQFAVSCSNLDDINENRNYPSQVSPQLLLTKIQKEAGKVEGLDPLYSVRMVILTSEENPYQYYKWNSGKFDDYLNLLQVIKMIEEANRVNNTNYLAIGKFFRAFYFYRLTLTFGDIPYNEALSGETQEIFTTRYDTQETVLEGILNELEEAVNMINATQSVNGDLYYSGNMQKWRKLMNSYRLKILLSLSKKTKVGSIIIGQKFKGIFENEPIISSNSDNAQLPFYDQEGSRYTQFNSSTYASSLYLSDSFIEFFRERKDPRIFTFAQQTVASAEKGIPITDYNSYHGGNPIVPYAENEKLVAEKNISKINNRFYSDPVNEPYTLLSYSETEFILAEATVRGWIASNAGQHYENAIKASFEYYQTYVKNAENYFKNFNMNEYLSQESVKYKTENTQSQLNQILTQKYMIMFHQSGWTAYQDYLRTGYPELPQQQQISAPVRWMYPITEYNKNPVNVKEAIERQFGGNDNTRSTPWWLK
ncbi:SusD/RagB family nutrient-binding outer membrane lipoprotein [Apibacter raozihei]|uniref:SusD/RagB family nutrient-binding outer membrane lipoprotein n=1 Tax=Apibacter raozihei TaxID=2500547 RepID=UPI000FE2D599|nr:SusD/RagB family nutrient-binding outer membrane lipoprotein [Apibacter raozihei]